MPSGKNVVGSLHVQCSSSPPPSTPVCVCFTGPACRPLPAPVCRPQRRQEEKRREQQEEARLRRIRQRIDGQGRGQDAEAALSDNEVEEI